MKTLGDDAAAIVSVPRRLDPAAGRRAPRVVALGGGTGVPVLLRGLRELIVPPVASPAGGDTSITAIITTADDGGSSGRLRRAYGTLAPGDVRNALVALSGGDGAMAALFDFRFDGEGDVAGHSLGNLILTALADIEGSFAGAVRRAAEILAVRGRVLSATNDEVRLVAEFVGGARVEGESRIAGVGRPIHRVQLTPATAAATPEALRAIAAADVVVIGPGSLYTSLIPVLLVRDLARALAHARARVVLVMNLMTEPGETDGYTAADCLAALRRHAPEVTVHEVLLNTAPIPARLLERYAADGAAPIRADVERLRALGCRPFERDLLGSSPKVRHDVHKLARAILELAEETYE